MSIYMKRFSSFFFWFGMIALVLVRLWFSQGQRLVARTDLVHDDALFINQAESILDGTWLGQYNQLTLIKGPVYPLWIAFSYVIRMPLLWSQILLYIFACIMTCVALWPYFRSKAFQLLLFAVLLFNPFPYVIDHPVLRGEFYTAIALLTCAMALGMYVRLKASLAGFFAWSIGLGISLSLFVFTREDWIWITPAVLLLMTGMEFAIRQGVDHQWTRRGILLVPLCLVLLTKGDFAYLNMRFYRTPVINELTGSDFTAAYKSLLRVKHPHWKQYIPVPKEVRTEIYRVSPHFAELQPYLEGMLGDSWVKNSREALPPEYRKIHEIGGGWFIFALRDAAEQAGHHQTAGDAMAFYAAIALEVEDACRTGRLDCSPQGLFLMPPWRGEYTAQLPHFMTQSFWTLIYAPFSDRYREASYGTDAALGRFKRLTGDQLMPPVDDPAMRHIDVQQNGKKDEMIHGVTWMYRHLVYPSFILACLYSVWLFAHALRKKIFTWQVLFSLGLFASIAALVLIVSLLTVTSFYATSDIYLAPAYPLVLLFIMMNSWFAYEQATRAWSRQGGRRRSRKRPI